VASAALAVVVCCSVTVATAIAQTQKHPIDRGSVSAPPLRWEASAVPFMLERGGSSILIDVFDRSGTRVTTYGANHVRVPSGRSIRATEFRPPRTRPSRNAIVAGVVGASVRRVRVEFRSGPSRTFRTVAAPRDWPRANYRLFAVGTTVASRHRTARRLATRIDGFNSRGRRIARQRSITSF
jgi:hypothetical protein